jgi:phosphoribosylformylglycinamidine synthase
VPAAVDAVHAKLLGAAAGVTQLFRSPGLTASKARSLLRRAREEASDKIVGVDSELCYNVATSAPLTAAEAETLAWLLRETFEPEALTAGSRFAAPAPGETVVEVRVCFIIACLVLRCRRGGDAHP